MFVQRTKVLQISLLAIFSAFLVELIFGLISNSLALLTDSIHALIRQCSYNCFTSCSKNGNKTT